MPNTQAPQTPPKAPGLTIEKLKAEALTWWDFLRDRLKDIPGNHLVIGKNFLESGAYKDAGYRFRIVRWMRPKHVEATALLVQAYAKDGEFAKAKMMLAELAQIAPQSPLLAEARAVLASAMEPKKPAATPAATAAPAEPAAPII